MKEKMAIEGKTPNDEITTGGSIGLSKGSFYFEEEKKEQFIGPLIIGSSKEERKCSRCGRCCYITTLLEDSSWMIKLAGSLILLFIAPKMVFKKPVCFYLVFENGFAKCLNYENRPQFCRDYFCNRCEKVDNKLTKK